MAEKRGLGNSREHAVAKERVHTTHAIRVLKEQSVDFTLRPYRGKERGGTAVAARALGVDEHRIIKTLVMEDESGEPLLVLMHGDRKASTKALARSLGVKAVEPCDPEVAHKHTGYVAGGISPFGTRKPLRVFIERSILELPRCYISAGKRGLLVELSPDDLVRVLKPIVVNIAI